MAMVLIQCNEKQEPKVTQFRKQMTEVIENKHADTLAKFGAILASGEFLFSFPPTFFDFLDAFCLFLPGDATHLFFDYLSPIFSFGN